MGIGDFTKENASRALNTVSDMFEAIPKSKRGGYLGHLNEVSLFIEAARRIAKPEKKK